MEQESMKWVAGIRFLVWSMLTWVQPVGECALSPSDAASLCYIFTVGKSGSGPWWHKVQGQLNEETFINCDSNNNCHATGLLGNRLMVTKLWKTQAEPLKDGIHLLKAELIDMTNKTRGTEPLTLQARMCCCYEDGHFDGFWNIGLNGHKILHFDLSTGKLTKAEGSKKRLTSSDVTDFFYMTSHGDCRSWLKEFKSHWEEKLEPIESLLLFISLDLPCSVPPFSRIIHPHASSPARGKTMAYQDPASTTIAVWFF
ncbi:UL16-binding protein 1 isoform X2 [Cricetulus griseus]|uniref:UL16-binding protein 1 isoform X2 n=1 Tax=Cricetulus griseus TaxID=10029 RepID=UPI0007DA7D53|nr:UL16-binding protein 1 isoform X2 [Cricetulus griseus]